MPKGCNTGAVILVRTRNKKRKRKRNGTLTCWGRDPRKHGTFVTPRGQLKQDQLALLFTLRACSWEDIPANGFWRAHSSQSTIPYEYMSACSSGSGRRSNSSQPAAAAAATFKESRRQHHSPEINSSTVNVRGRISSAAASRIQTPAQ